MTNKCLSCTSTNLKWYAYTHDYKRLFACSRHRHKLERRSITITFPVAKITWTHDETRRNPGGAL